MAPEPAPPRDPEDDTGEALAAGNARAALAILDERRKSGGPEPPKLAVLRAEILIRHLSRSRQGLDVLRGLDRALLGGSDRRRPDDLAAAAEVAIDRGELELSE